MPEYATGTCAACGRFSMRLPNSPGTGLLNGKCKTCRRKGAGDDAAGEQSGSRGAATPQGDARSTAPADASCTRAGCPVAGPHRHTLRGRDGQPLLAWDGKARRSCSRHGFHREGSLAWIACFGYKRAHEVGPK